ncbi:DUF962 domain-containing protein [Endozoicomonas sp. Mp262]|uniref:Mpo1 family 2-hydroxy fatty acid dioxygenase n=1 Tax=Endozoicomonas sp. Mp262 TaxID=2919499 RepID=UPI0021D9D8A8
MKTLEHWLKEYGESHQHPTNKLIHWVCIPLITFSVLGLLWSLHWGLTAAVIVMALLFYIRLSIKLAMTMLTLAALMLATISALQPIILPVSLGIFIIAWIFQFIGHHIEGKKPSFFKDLQFLFIGPLWLLAFLFRQFRMRY